MRWNNWLKSASEPETVKCEEMEEDLLEHKDYLFKSEGEDDDNNMFNVESFEGEGAPLKLKERGKDPLTNNLELLESREIKCEKEALDPSEDKAVTSWVSEIQIEDIEGSGAQVFIDSEGHDGNISMKVENYVNCETSKNKSMCHKHELTGEPSDHCKNKRSFHATSKTVLKFTCRKCGCQFPNRISLTKHSCSRCLNSRTAKKCASIKNGNNHFRKDLAEKSTVRTTYKNNNLRSFITRQYLQVSSSSRNTLPQNNITKLATTTTTTKLANFSNKKRLPDKTVENYICRRCGDKYEYIKVLVRHKCILLTDFVCRECGGRMNGTHIENHIDVCVSQKYECQKCGVRFNSNLYLEAHTKLQENGLCNMNDHVELSQTTLTQEIEAHVGSSTKSSESEVPVLQSLSTDQITTPHQRMETHEEISNKSANYEVTSQSATGTRSEIHNPHSLTQYQCRECNMKFNKKPLLVSHSLTAHSTRLKTSEKCKCNKCTLDFPCRAYYVKHLLTHFESLPYKCQLCNNKYNKMCNLMKHYQNVHTTKIDKGALYKCQICTHMQFFLSQESYAVHLLTHSKSKQFQCQTDLNQKINSYAGSTSQHNDSLKDDDNSKEADVRSRLEPNGDGSNIFKCLKCLAEFCSESEMVSHSFVKHHLNVPPGNSKFCKGTEYKLCNICTRFFSSQEAYIYHLLTHSRSKQLQRQTESNKKTKGCAGSSSQHNEPIAEIACRKPIEENESELNKTNHNKSQLGPQRVKVNIDTELESMYACLLCSKQYDSLSKIESHNVTQGTCCHICSKQIESECYLLPHYKYNCWICYEQFVTQTELESHMNTHKYKCHICSKKFKSEDDLGVHQNVHYGFECGVCFRPFKNQKALETHKNAAHHPKRKCTHCNRLFHTKAHWDAHSSKYLAGCRKKDFRCLICLVNFNRESDLAEHNKVVHSDSKNIQCLVCSKVFWTNYGLEQHMMTYSKVP